MRIIRTIRPHILPFIYAIFGITFVINIVTALNIVFLGSFPFWYDPARDILQALANLHKVTLIGPPSGIPGVFYGPYWIWLLSIGLRLSRDPRIVTVIAATIPYVLLLPLLFWKFSDIFSKKISFGLCILLLFTNFFSYATNLWNPYISPVLFLLLAYIMSHHIEGKEINKVYMFFAGGFLAGIISNFNLSFGLGVVGGTILFTTLYSFIETVSVKKMKTAIWGIINISVTFLGILLAYTPFFIFEYRHQFIQSKAFLHTVTNSLFYDSAVVGQHGIQGFALLRTFFGVFAAQLQLPELVIYPLILILFAYLLRKYLHEKKVISKISLQNQSVKLLLFLLSVFITILYLYFTTKNPIWIYHFIGVDILYILGIGLIAKQSKLLTNLFLFWTVVICVMHTPQMISSLSQIGVKNAQISSLSTKETVVNKIVEDAGQNQYEVFVYNPAIYVYDYDYLLQWKTGKTALYHPKSLSSLPSTIYIIMPKAKKSTVEDYINYVTPSSSFTTRGSFLMGDGITIIKRVKI